MKERPIIRVRRTGGSPNSWYAKIPEARDLLFDVRKDGGDYALADTPHNFEQFKKFEEAFLNYRQSRGNLRPMRDTPYQHWTQKYYLSGRFWEEAVFTNREAVKFLVKEEE